MLHLIHNEYSMSTHTKAASCALLLIGLVFSSGRAFADDGPSTCFYSRENGSPTTCKEIRSVDDVTTLDPRLKDRFVLASHEDLCEDAKYSNWYLERYSESISDIDVYSVSHPHSDTRRAGPVLIDRKFVTNYINNAYSKTGLSFDGTLNGKEIYILGNAELNTVCDPFTGDKLVDYLKQSFDVQGEKDLTEGLMHVDTDSEKKDQLVTKILTFNNYEFGKHIQGVDVGIAELSYVPKLGQSEFQKFEKDLGLEVITCGHWGMGECYTAPLNSPVKSIESHWVYTEKDGGLVYEWQGSSVHLDDGSTKEYTNNSLTKNVVPAQKEFGGTTTAAEKVENSKATSVDKDLSESSSQEVRSPNFLERIWNFIVSLF